MCTRFKCREDPHGYKEQAANTFYKHASADRKLKDATEHPKNTAQPPTNLSPLRSIQQNVPPPAVSQEAVEARSPMDNFWTYNMDPWSNSSSPEPLEIAIQPGNEHKNNDGMPDITQDNITPSNLACNAPLPSDSNSIEEGDDSSLATLTSPAFQLEEPPICLAYLHAAIGQIFDNETFLVANRWLQGELDTIELCLGSLPKHSPSATTIVTAK